jgi:hypothetical protein
MDGPLKETERHVVSSGSEASGGRSESESGSGSRSRKTASAGVIASSRSGVKSTASRQAKIGGRASNWEVDSEGATVHGIGAKRNDGV